MSDDTPTPASEDAATELAPMARIGEALSQARAARGLSIEDVAAQLKFAPRQVMALEQGHSEGIPAGTFARGMVRSYCRVLRIDPEPLLALMPVAVPDADRLTERFSQPVPFSDPARRWNVAYATLAVIALAVAGWVAYEWQSSPQTPQAAVPAAPESADAPPAQPTVETVSSTPGGAPAFAPEARDGAASSSPASPASEPAPPASKPLAEKPAPGVRRLVLRFQREAWVEVRDGAGRTVFSELSPAGSERVVDSRAPTSLVIGNAQYVKLSMDGTPVDLQPYIKVEVARLTLP